ncbi:MerR family transcriptional regulator [Lutispora thermophila]|uniref:Helix-turn-helix domain-containing protein n=1 Tax=Lutispora thermophila DSM 19022 TaxID=1122184 RepID=A0A1M6CRH7_9FIRM|nr:helix-turn-helix domain-containing protein [Lutispora thermophila]SHI63559.1 hypothetical protein SAMN02745176_00908 [Lutispora thermophila DSM 19022]
MFSFNSRDDLAKFIQENTVNTTEAAKLMGCTRQNIADLIKRGKLTPIKVMPDDKLFWKDDIIARVKKNG